MPQYLSPGVYVEEIDAGPKPIEGVSTSVCGAVGVTVRGPTKGKPVLVTSFPDFTRTFGAYLTQPDAGVMDNWNNTTGGAWWQFPLAVKSFFDNGGQQLYVKRVFNIKNAVAASADLERGLISAVVKDAAADATLLQLDHLIGITLGGPFKLRKGDGTGDITTVTVVSIDEAAKSVTLAAAIGQAALAKRGDFLEIKAISVSNGGNDKRTLHISAKGQGAWGNAVKVRIEPMVGPTYNILATDPAAAIKNRKLDKPTGEKPTDTLTLDDAGDLAKGDHVVIAGTEYELADNHAGNDIKLLNEKIVAAKGTAVLPLRKANTPNTAAPLSVWGASAIYDNAIVELSNGIAKEVFHVQKVAGNAVTLAGNPPKLQYFEGSKLRIIEARISVSFAPSATDTVEEVHSNLRLVDDKTPDYLPIRLRDRSNLIEATVLDLPGTADLGQFPITPVNGGWKNLDRGDDSFPTLTADDFVGMDRGSGERTGIAALEDIDDISICIVPGMWSPVVQSALITHCELLRSRFAVLDPKDWLDVAGIQAFRQGFNTKYAALYHPYVVTRDPSISQDVRIAPSGHIAGIYARVDNARGVHKAPANEVLLNVTKLGLDVNKREHDLLNPVNINVLRFFPDRGNLVWGARCITDDSAWKYINVRRLFIYVEQSIERGTQWVVFEPNDEPLWARVRQSITNFLTTVWRSGALQGGKPAEAFFVKCDRTTMTQDDIDNGRLICVIGIAPVKPAEFVIFRIQQKTLDQTTP